MAMGPHLGRGVRPTRGSPSGQTQMITLTTSGNGSLPFGSSFVRRGATCISCSNLVHHQEAIKNGRSRGSVRGGCLFPSPDMMPERPAWICMPCHSQVSGEVAMEMECLSREGTVEHRASSTMDARMFCSSKSRRNSRCFNYR